MTKIFKQVHDEHNAYEKFPLTKMQTNHSLSLKGRPNELTVFVVKCRHECISALPFVFSVLFLHLMLSLFPRSANQRASNTGW